MSIGLSRSLVRGVDVSSRFSGLRRNCAQLYNPLGMSMFPPPVPQLSLNFFNGASGSGGGNNPLNFTWAPNHAPAVGQLILVYAGYGGSVNQIFQPGDTLPSQPINLNISDGINAYTRIAYQEVFPPYLGGGISALAEGWWASIANNSTNIANLTATTNTLHDTGGSTGYTSQAQFFSYMYILSPGRMPQRMYDFYSLTQNVTLPRFTVNTGYFGIVGFMNTNGVVSSNLNIRNSDLLETSPFVAPGFVTPTANGNATATPLWVGSVIRI